VDVAIAGATHGNDQLCCLHRSPKKVEAFISNTDMWEATFILQRCLFPMIRVLRLGDVAACGGMSKIVYFVHKTNEAIQKLMVLLKELKYFADHQQADADDVEVVDLADDDFDDDDMHYAEKCS
jgi:hypothetical protein